jgi:drug/metabolite transporter (DMT)-like permease
LVNNPPLPKTAARRWSSNDLLILGVVLIWGINFSVIKVTLRSMSPMAFNGLRFGLATIVMLIILRCRRESLWVARRDILPVFLLGLVGHTFYQVLFLNGMARTTPANASLLMATAPIFVVIYGYVLGIERTNRWIWGGILLSFAGILLLIGGGGGLKMGVGMAKGDLLVLAAAMLWAAYTTGSKPLLARYSPLKLTASSMVAGAAPLVLISLPAMRTQDWGAVPAGAWAGLLYSAVFSVALAYIGWYTSVQRVGNARTAVYSNLTPVIAILVAWVFLGSTLAPLQIVGAAVVLAGVMLTRRGRFTAGEQRSGGAEEQRDEVMAVAQPKVASKET